MKNTRWSLATGKDMQAVTSMEALKLTELDWNVLQAPVYYKIAEQMIEDSGSRINYRSDTNALLGRVSNSYKVLQNSAAFQFCDSLIGVAEAMYVNVGSFKGGSKVYIQAK